MPDKIKAFSAFSGIGAFEKAAKNVGLDYEVVHYAECDTYCAKCKSNTQHYRSGEHTTICSKCGKAKKQYASYSFSKLHNIDEGKNLYDITTVDYRNIKPFDVFTYAYPCTDISSAGKMLGINKGTRSGLLYHALEIIKQFRPKYAIAENVKNLVVNNRFKNDFAAKLQYLQTLGYNNYWAILNADDFGIPQSRSRVFVVSIRKDVDDGKFNFEFLPTQLKPLQSFLDNYVDEGLYIDQTKVDKFIPLSPHYDLIQKLQSTYSNSNFVVGCSFRTRMYNGQPQRLEIRKDFLSNTITTVSKDSMIYFINQQKIRYLSPMESWRLMGFDDQDYLKIKDIPKGSQYKQAGNSIVVSKIESIFKNLFQ